MKRFVGFLSAVAFAALVVLPAYAQDKDKEALKKELLEKVSKRIAEEQDKLLKDIEKVIDEELARAKKSSAPTPGGVVKPAEPPKVEPPKVEPPKPPAPEKKARGYLGIRPADLSEDEKKDLGVKNGFKIDEVLAGTPAEKGGLKADDVVTSINGKPVDAAQDVPPIIQAAGAGATLKMEVVREGKKKTLDVTLGRHPDEPAEAEPQAQAPKAAPPAAPKEGDLRERVKKFLNKEEEDKKAQPQAQPKAAPKKEEPKGDFFPALDSEFVDKLKEQLGPLGVDLDEFLEKGDDGKYHLAETYREKLKGLEFDFRKYFGLPGGEEKKPEQKAAPRPAVKPYLGLQPEELPDDIRAQVELEEGVGLLVADVKAGSPAEAAGLKKNDILVKLDDRKMRGEDALAKFMESARAGQDVKVTVIRRGKEQTFTVKLAERKE
jgi:C-terminal processing protease CtpA/Prc